MYKNRCQSQPRWLRGLLLVLRCYFFFLLAGDKDSLRNKKKSPKIKTLICPTIIIFISRASLFLFHLNLGQWKIGKALFGFACFVSWRLITENLLTLRWSDVHNLKLSLTQRKLPEGAARQKRLQMSWSINLWDEILHGYSEIPFCYNLSTDNEWTADELWRHSEASQ